MCVYKLLLHPVHWPELMYQCRVNLNLGDHDLPDSVSNYDYVVYLSVPCQIPFYYIKEHEQCTVLYCILLSCTILYCTIMYCTELYTVLLR